MGRSVFAAVATAALCVYGAGTARAEPRADVRGDINSDLRERIVRAIGEAERPVGRETAFRIASMTKNMTALAVLALRDQGRLALDAPLAEYVPQFAKVRPSDQE